MYVTGTLNYSSSSSATTTVVNGKSILNQDWTTSGQIAVINKDESTDHPVVNDNGEIIMTNGSVEESAASLVLTNGAGETHGLVVTERQLTLSGGTYSNSMTLNDNGATFQNSATGGPVKVTGVADGSSKYDAVNYGQLEDVESKVSGGVAMVAGLASIPQVEQCKTYSLGAGTGFYNGETAIAVGGSVRVARNAIFKGGISFSTSDSEPVGNAGIAFSW